MQVCTSSLRSQCKARGERISLLHTSSSAAHGREDSCRLQQWMDSHVGFSVSLTSIKLVVMLTMMFKSFCWGSCVWACASLVEDFTHLVDVVAPNVLHTTTFVHKSAVWSAVSIHTSCLWTCLPHCGAEIFHFAFLDLRRFTALKWLGIHNLKSYLLDTTLLAGICLLASKVPIYGNFSWTQIM